MAQRTRQASLPGMEEGDASGQGTAQRGSKRRAQKGGDPQSATTNPEAHASGSPSDASGSPESQSAVPVPRPLAPDPCPLAPALADKVVYVIDANSLIYQVFHAIPEMTSPAGEPVNAVFGFARDLLFLLSDKKPDYLLVAFDLPGPTFRHELYSDYKVHRAEMPDELVPQLPAIRRVVEALGIPILELESYEADDILATVADLTEAGGGQCYVVTADKDCRQLISERVKIYNVRKNLVYDDAALLADWGVRPDQVVDFQSLVGDPVDHVPGVPLIGPKIAQELLAKYGTLEAVLDNAGDVSGTKRRENLLNGRQKALLSRELVRLKRDVPIDIDWALARVRSLDVPKVVDLFTELGFHRFTDQVRALSTGAPPQEWQADYRIVDTPEKFAAFLTELEGQTRVSIDTETTSISPTEAEIVGYSFAWTPGVAYYLPVRALEGEPRLDPAETLAALKPFFENSSIGKVGQNLKYDMIVLRQCGVRVAGVAFDTMLASYLLDAGERNHNLDELALRYLDHANIKISALIGTGKQQKRMDEVSVAAVGPYAAEDADVPLRLLPMLVEKLRASNLEDLLNNVELPLIDVLVELECNGIRVDVDRLHELSAEYGHRLDTLEREIYALAGRPFNIGSPKQLQQVLFVEQGLPTLKKIKSGASTDVDVLEELAHQHPLPAKIIEYRQFAKLKNTYVDALPGLVNPKTGRVHASFHQAVAATGRLSSSDPNLQNIPIRTEEGREIRSAFLPGPQDWMLLAADYSQIELRVLAHFSGDTTLCDAFASGHDIHAQVAAQVFGVAMDDVTSEMRRRAKAVNFGVLYGQSAFGLARSLQIEQAEAAAFIDAYFTRYSGVEEFLAKILAEARENGYVKTILGRRRAIRGVRPDAPRQRNLPERTAINTVIQGSAADLIKLAMIVIHRRLRDQSWSAKMLLQIHDELIFEVPPHELSNLAEMVAAEMAGVMPLNVPLVVDVKTGASWADAD